MLPTTPACPTPPAALAHQLEVEARLGTELAGLRLAYARRCAEGSQRAIDALADLIKLGQARARALVHVQAAPDLDHDGTHPKVPLIEAHRYERTGERPVDRHAPPQLLEHVHRAVAQPGRRVDRVCADADVGAVGVLVVLVGQRACREAVPVDQQACSVGGEGIVDRRVSAR